MAEIVNINHDGGGTPVECGYTTSSGTDMSVIAGAALAGTRNGVNVLIDDTTATYYQKTVAAVPASGILRIRIYFDPNSYTDSANWENLLMHYLLSQTSPYNLGYLGVTKVGATYYGLCAAFNDAGADGLAVGNYSMTDAPHLLEYKITRASTNIAADGTAEFWIDGVSKKAITNLDNYDVWAGQLYVRLGAWGKTATMGGNIFSDELVVNDDGGLIGPRLSTSDLGAKAFGYQFPTMGETGVSWTTWDDGAAGAITVSGDADWGKGELDIGEEMRSAVYDLGDIGTRTITLTPNRYGTGSGTATLQYRTDTSSFTQDSNVIGWTTYTVPFAVSCRYVQIRETK